MAVYLRSHVFIARDGKILVLERVTVAGVSWWGQPGGGLEPGETPADAAIRETLEETALAIETPELLRTWSYRDRRGDQVKCFMHVAEAPHGDVTLSTEHTAYAWMSIDEYERQHCSEPMFAADWVEAFLAEMRLNCDAFREWQRAKPRS